MRCRGAQLEDLRLAWNIIHAKRDLKTASMELPDFLAVLKCLGIQLNKKERWVLTQEYSTRGPFVFEDLVHVGCVAWTEEVLQESLLAALQKLDPQKTGRVYVSDLRQHLYKLGVGVRLTLEEIDVFLQLFEEAKTGSLPIDKLIVRILAE